MQYFNKAQPYSNLNNVFLVGIYTVVAHQNSKQVWIIDEMTIFTYEASVY